MRLPERGAVIESKVESAHVGSIDYAAYLPSGYSTSEGAYPCLYLLHGRGDNHTAWRQIIEDVDQLISDELIPPLIIIMPDAPWNERGSWYTNSDYRGEMSPGMQVETAFTEDLLNHVDITYRTVPQRAHRFVGGYSMGGAGALRMTLAHQDKFSAGIILSPAVYAPQPPELSSVRRFGGYGTDGKLFCPFRYRELSYSNALKTFDSGMPVKLFIAVGDGEEPNPRLHEAHHDLDFESAQLYNRVKRVEGVSAKLRVLDGGHGWDVWQPALSEGLINIFKPVAVTMLTELGAECKK